MNAPASALGIREATQADIDVLVQFNAAMARETEAKTLDPAVLKAGVAAVLAEPRRGFYLVAEQAGEIAACLMITYEWSDWRNGDWWWLQSVYVRPEHRRGGVFRALYAQVERRAATSAGVAGLRLYVERDNASAQQTYATLGMHETHYRMYEKAASGCLGEPTPSGVRHG
ncbi:MAG: GNAT family N-acetyltransferase [Rudaea sp.]|nr:GNAT family N-acetyltransferase [Rudaea sp.]